MVEPQQLRSLLVEKCAVKHVSMPTMERLLQGGLYEDLVISWERMLKHQLSILEPVEQYWQQLPQVFEWLYA